MAAHAVIHPTPADLEDIQGLVYNPWNDHHYSGFLFAQLPPDAARGRAWLDAIRGGITNATRAHRPPDHRLQLALSPQGLTALGVPDDVLAGLPQEAKLGMASRARLFGDADPATWRLGRPDQRLDVLVMIYAREEATRDALVRDHKRALVEAGALVHPEELACPLVGREHFGFADGLSQPFLPGVHGKPRPGETAVAAGEILLGYPNAYGVLPQSPQWGELDVGRNGTYLVFRKLDQHVAKLWSWLGARAAELAPNDVAATTEWLAAKVMGRWRSGAPLVLTPDRDDPELAKPHVCNDFRYLETDADGTRCPIAAHVRRANPRDARSGNAADSEEVISHHRILRRGRSYGAPLADADARAGRDDGTERGLYFICLQASIARGFELIQQTWLTNPAFHGLAGEPDPIVGNGDGTGFLTIPADPLRLRLANVPVIVTVAGGGYFFLPSRTALARIAST